MRIGLISDTHCQGDASSLPAEVLRIFAGVDLILHAGDIYSLDVLDRLETLAPALAIRGYADPVADGTRLCERSRVVAAEGLRIGLVHDLGWPGPRIKADTTLEFPREPLPDVLRRKFGEVVDIVVFGDSHEELILWHEGVLFVNPGSPTYPGTRHPLGSLGTVGFLEIGHGSAKAEIVSLRS